MPGNVSGTPAGAREDPRGEGCLGFPLGPVVSTTQSRISRRRWMDVLFELK